MGLLTKYFTKYFSADDISINILELYTHGHIHNSADVIIQSNIHTWPSDSSDTWFLCDVRIYFYNETWSSSVMYTDASFGTQGYDDTGHFCI